MSNPINQMIYYLLQNVVHVHTQVLFPVKQISFFHYFLRRTPNAMGTGMSFNSTWGQELKGVHTLHSRPWHCPGGPAICQSCATCMVTTQCCRDGGSAHLHVARVVMLSNDCQHRQDLPFCKHSQGTCYRQSTTLKCVGLEEDMRLSLQPPGMCNTRKSET